MDLQESPLGILVVVNPAVDVLLTGPELKVSNLRVGLVFPSEGYPAKIPEA